MTNDITLNYDESNVWETQNFVKKKDLVINSMNNRKN